MKELAADERLVPVMIYTPNMLIHGELIAKKEVRVSILLRTQGVPNYLHIVKAHVISFGGTPPKSQSFAEMFVATPTVIAFHLVPPAQDPMDYDPTEANRIMHPIYATVGTFLFKGNTRISAQTDVGVSLEVGRVSWLSLYDVQISNPYLPQFGLKVPMLVVKPDQVSFALE